MRWITFFYVAMASSLLAIIWQLCFNVYPAWRRVKIARALAVLARCITKINQDALLNGKIHHKCDLHDQYYRFLFNALTHRINLRFNMLSSIRHDGAAERKLREFQKEMKGLDTETQEMLRGASFAIGKILLLRSPMIFLLTCWKIERERYSFLTRESRRMEVAMTAEFITINAKDREDYNLIPIYV